MLTGFSLLCTAQNNSTIFDNGTKKLLALIILAEISHFKCYCLFFTPRSFCQFSIQITVLIF